MQDAARAVGLQIHVLNASAEGEITSAFARLAELHAGALIVGTGELFNSRPERLAELAARQRIPTIYQGREFVTAGGLISYGSSRIDAYRQVGVYVGRVLKGERPADLPVARPTKFELVINLKTAKALGLTIPSGVIAIADEVIEEAPLNVRYWHKADIPSCTVHVRFRGQSGHAVLRCTRLLLTKSGRVPCALIPMEWHPARSEWHPQSGKGALAAPSGRDDNASFHVRVVFAEVATVPAFFTTT